MNTGDLQNTLHRILSSETRKTAILLLGPPGVGKTSIVDAACRLAKKKLITFALPTCEAVDLRGLPHVLDGTTKWASPMPKEGKGVILLDELSSAAPDVQVAAHHLVWAEAGSDMSLPEGWHVVLTGNRAQDKTLHRAVSGPLRNRLTIINVEPDVAAWCKWAMDSGIDSSVVGFMRWRPELLTAKEIPADGAFTSPRAWHRASDLLGLGLNTHVEREMLSGTIGEGATVEFSAYLSTLRDLPSIQAIMANQAKAALPTSPSLLYAIVTALAQYTREKLESAMEYVNRMPAEFGLLYITYIRDHFEIKDDKHIRTWVSQHKVLFNQATA